MQGKVELLGGGLSEVDYLITDLLQIRPKKKNAIVARPPITNKIISL